MPRRSRAWDVGAIHQIGARAWGGEAIFASDADRAFVLERAARAFRETGVVCLGGAVLCNHYHFLVRCPGAPGPAVLRLNSAIARRVRLRGGVGAVFQGRYHSGVCRDDASLVTRLAYVIGNPVRHRVVAGIRELTTHRWSTLGEALGLRDAVVTSPAATLELLHDDPDVARRRLIDVLEMHASLWAARRTCPDDEP